MKPPVVSKVLGLLPNELAGSRAHFHIHRKDGRGAGALPSKEFGNLLQGVSKCKSY